ncbi:MAG TPA: hypothetical protein VJ044_20325 [Candidatus Hodarchaeales archaeon]|nr:hypothetical protein [Candidatus Hodarchaeales archaeon]
MKKRARMRWAMNEEQEAYNAWLAMQDIQKMAQGYENAVDLLQTKYEEIGDLRDQLVKAKEIIKSLIKVEWTMDIVGFSEECPWCESPKVNIYADSPHEPDCPHRAAVDFLEGK